MTDAEVEPRADCLDEDLGWLLGVVFRTYVKASEHAFHDLPGGPRGFQVLAAAAGRTPRNQGAIAEKLGIDRTVFTYLIDELERLNLVSRKPDPADRRSRLVVATAAGREVWRQRRDALRRVEAHVLGPLAPPAATAFRGLLRQLARGAQAVDALGDVCGIVEQAQPPVEGTTATLASPRSGVPVPAAGSRRARRAPGR